MHAAITRIVVFASLLSAPAYSQSLFDGSMPSFTALQAARGKTLYLENCASCHGAGLEDGQFGPPLKGPAFKAHWHDQRPEALLSMMTTRMPPAAPGAVGTQGYADIQSYLMQANGHAPGEVEFGSIQPSDKGRKETASDERAPGSNSLANEDEYYKSAVAKNHDILDRMSPVSEQMLANPPPADWLMWRGGFATQGFSKLTQITEKSVARLGVGWTLSLPISADESAPLVHDGVLFVMSADTVLAVDAATGNILWRYLRRLPEALHGGREARMKGMAILGSTLYAPTAEGHVVALDVRNGSVRWDHAVVTDEQGPHPGQFDGSYFHISGGPLIAHGKVLVGVSLGIDTGGGDFVVGLDAESGTELWRFDTIARPGQPGGDSWNGAPVKERFGSGVWTIGSYDPILNLAYFGTGNTYDVGTLLTPRSGKRLSNNDAFYTDSTLALNPDDGKLMWHFQHMNRDVWDMDWVFEQTLIDLPMNGKTTRSLITGGKLAIFDAVDRATGRYLFSKDLGVQTLVSSIDPVSGKKHTDPKLEPSSTRKDVICPAATGARSWPSTAVDPNNSTLFVPLQTNTCMEFGWAERSAAEVAAGGLDLRMTPRLKAGHDGQFGRLDAIDLKSRKVLWSMRQRAPIASSLLASEGGVLFAGSRDRGFRAYSSASGRELWQTTLNASPSSSPITYEVNGEQYIAVIAGGGGAFDASARGLTPEIVDPAAGMTLWVFKLKSLQ